MTRVLQPVRRMSIVHQFFACAEQNRARQQFRSSARRRLAADDAGMPDDPEFRSALVAYLEWGTRIALGNSQPGAAVMEHAPVPKGAGGRPRRISRNRTGALVYVAALEASLTIAASLSELEHGRWIHMRSTSNPAVRQRHSTDTRPARPGDRQLLMPWSTPALRLAIRVSRRFLGVPKPLSWSTVMGHSALQRTAAIAREHPSIGVHRGHQS